MGGQHHICENLQTLKILLQPSFKSFVNSVQKFILEVCFCSISLQVSYPPSPLLLVLLKSQQLLWFTNVSLHFIHIGTTSMSDLDLTFSCISVPSPNWAWKLFKFKDLSLPAERLRSTLSRQHILWCARQTDSLNRSSEHAHQSYVFLFGCILATHSTQCRDGLRGYWSCSVNWLGLQGNFILLKSSEMSFSRPARKSARQQP